MSTNTVNPHVNSDLVVNNVKPTYSLENAKKLAAYQAIDNHVEVRTEQDSIGHRILILQLVFFYRITKLLASAQGRPSFMQSRDWRNE